MAKSTNPFRYFDSSPEVIRLVVVMPYLRLVETSCRWTDSTPVKTTRGIPVGDRPDAAEQIAVQWAAISNRSDEQGPASGAAQYHHEIGHPDRPPREAPNRAVAQV